MSYPPPYRGVSNPPVGGRTDTFHIGVSYCPRGGASSFFSAGPCGASTGSVLAPLSFTIRSRCARRPSMAPPRRSRSSGFVRSAGRARFMLQVQMMAARRRARRTLSPVGDGRRRPTESLLSRHDEILARWRGQTPEQGWAQFYDTADRRVLVAVIKGLLAALPPARRAAVEEYLGANASAFRSPRAGVVRWNGAGELVEAPDELAAIEQVVTALAAGARKGSERKRHEAAGRPACDPIVWFRHLDIIQDRLGDMPKPKVGIPARRAWLRANLPSLFAALAEISCPASHERWAIKDEDDYVTWASWSRRPLGEALLAHHHNMTAKTMGRILSTAHSDYKEALLSPAALRELPPAD